MRFIAAAAIVLILAAPCLQAQEPAVTSSLPNAGAAVGVLLNSPYGKINFSPIAAGKFSSTSQSNGADLVTITFGTPFAGQFSCLQNLGSGEFSQPVLSQTITWPVAAVETLNFGTTAAPETDSIVVANAAGVTIYSFSNCVASVSSQIAMSNVTSISGLVAGSQQFLISCSNGVAVEDVTLSASTCEPFPTNSIFITGPFPPPFQFAGVQIVPTTSSQNNAVIALGYIAGNGSLVATNTTQLSGQQFLGCVFTPSVVCFSAT